MRRLIALLISLLLALNAANALAQGVCDAFDHALMHDCGGYMGHHDHHDGLDVPISDHVGSVEGDSPAQPHAHAHVHPSFSVLIAVDFALPLIAADARPQPGRIAELRSAASARLERPPRAGLA